MAAKLLKKAKLCIKDKDFEGALSICKDLLDDDDSNYNALVFVGVAQSKLEKWVLGEEAYIKATKVDPAASLAWQGLVGLYEKAPPRSIENTDQKLLEAYKTLELSYRDDAAKANQVHTKIGPLLLKLEEAADILEFFLDDLLKVQDDESRRDMIRHVVKFGPRHEKTLAKKHVDGLTGVIFPTKAHWEEGKRVVAKNRREQYERITSYMRENFKFATDTEARFKEVIERSLLLHELAEDDDSNTAAAKTCFEDCVAMTTAFPSHEFPFSVVLQLAEQDDVISATDYLSHAESLLKINPQSAAAMAVVGTDLYEKGDVVKGQDMIEKAVRIDVTCVPALRMLSKICFTTLNLDKCLEMATSVCHQILLREKVSGRQRWNKILFEVKFREGAACLASGSHTSQAASAYELVLARAPGSAQALTGLAEVAIVQGVLPKAKQLCEKAITITSGDVLSDAAVMSAQSWISFTEGDLSLAETQVNKAIELDSSVSKYHLRLGRVLWEQGSEARKNSLKSFIMAVQLDPNNSDAFAYLGHYYSERGRARTRAKKCFEKSVELLPLQFDAARQLARMYAEDGDTVNVLRVCTRVTDAARGANIGKVVWAWKEMSRTQLKLGKVDAAVISGQTSVRAAPSDEACWSLLGEAYSTRGSYIAALKAFERSIEINPQQPYCMYKAATVKQSLGQLQEAIESYKEVLAVDANYIAAIYAAAEAWFLQAKEYLADGLLGAMKEAIEASLLYLVDAIKISTTFSCVWKLLGDVCTSTHVLSPKLASQISLPQIPGVDPAIKILALGSKAFKKVLGLKPSSEGWVDLASSYFYRYKCYNKADESLAQDDLIASGLNAAKRAVSTDVSNSEAWNTLGVIAGCLQNFALAQHAYIKSLDLAPHTSGTWVNLGALYLNCGDLELANKSFAQAQSLEPSLSRAWVGQAMLAEMTENYEALDLFRHAFELHPYSQACLGFGYNVLAATTKTDGARPHQLPHGYEAQYIERAIVALRTYTRTRDGVEDVDAFNCLGMLFERKQLFEDAVKHLKIAVLLLEKKLGAEEQTRTTLTRLNLARTLSANNNAAASMDMYKQAGVQRIHDVCGLGFAAYRAGDLATSYKVYEQALAVAQSADDQKSVAEVYVSLATIACANNELELAKQLLFKAVVQPGLCPRSLFVMCALGLVKDDGVLAASALAEFPKLLSHGVSNFEQHLQDQSTLQCAMQRLQGAVKPALHALTKAIHIFPNMTKLWGDAASLINACPAAVGNVASHSLLDTDPFTTCALSAQAARSQQAVGVSGRNLSLLATAGLIKGSSNTSYEKQFNIAMKAVHENPSSPDTWAALSVVAYAEGARGNYSKHMNIALVAADKCVDLSTITPSSVVALPHSALRQRNMHYWGKVQSCWCRMACATMSATMQEVAPFLERTAAICQTAVQEYQQDPIRAAAFYALYARCQLAYGQIAEGLSSLVTSLKLNPSSSSCWELAGVLYTGLGLHTHALTCYTQALSLIDVVSVLRVTPLLRVTHVLAYHATDIEAAVTAVSSAVKIDSGSPTVRLCLGVAKLLNGDKKSGTKELNRVAEIYPMVADILEA